MGRFNSRSREGSDFPPLCPPAVRQVSIHAPARGATICYWLFNCLRMFQFTLPRGERPSSTLRHMTIGMFQFTLPRGERLVGDPSLQFVFIVSIHAPARGATHGYFEGFNRYSRFNSRSREGSDSIVGALSPAMGRFNSRSREGSDDAQPR